jgi:hypothetical protein
MQGTLNKQQVHSDWIMPRSLIFCLLYMQWPSYSYFWSCCQLCLQHDVRPDQLVICFSHNSWLHSSPLSQEGRLYGGDTPHAVGLRNFDVIQVISNRKVWILAQSGQMKHRTLHMCSVGANRRDWHEVMKPFWSHLHQGAPNVIKTDRK